MSGIHYIMVFAGIALTIGGSALFIYMLEETPKAQQEVINNCVIDTMETMPNATGTAAEYKALKHCYDTIHFHTPFITIAAVTITAGGILVLIREA